MDNIIEIKNISFKYQSEEDDISVWVLSDYSLSIERGSFVAILGHNASGKSTVAKLSNGLFKPNEGDILVNGMNTKNEKDSIEIRKTVGLVFQNPDNQMVATIVEEDVAFGPENLGIPPAEISERVDKALKSVDMYEYRKHAPHKLSGGQKQRVAIAGIIAMQPQCIVLDEPTAMLDPRGRREVIETITKLNKKQDITVILITHHMDEAINADRVVIMDKGKVVLDGTPKEIFSQEEKLKDAKLDVPDPTELCSRLKNTGFSLPDGVLSVDECVDAIANLIATSKT